MRFGHGFLRARTKSGLGKIEMKMGDRYDDSADMKTATPAPRKRRA
jgi:hypothetical protein